MNGEILYQVKEQVALLTLNRPDKLNAWTASMEAQFPQLMRRAAEDAEVRVIVVTGAGRGFCAGADMSLLEGVRPDGASPLGEAPEIDYPPDAPPELRKRYSWLCAIPKPVIAAVNGPAVGLGFVLALYCDLRIASTQARFGTAFARRGLVAEFGLAWMLPRVVGFGNAADLLLTARLIDAQEALRIGLASRVMHEDTFLDEALGFAREMAAGVSPRSTRVIKQQVYYALGESLGHAIDRGWREMKASLQTEDFREGVAHYRQKRPPRFTGK